MATRWITPRAGCGAGVDPQAMGCCLSRRGAHRRVELLDRKARAYDALRRVLILQKTRSTIHRLTTTRRCPTWSASPGRAWRCTPVILPAIRRATAASSFRLNSPSFYLASLRYGTPVIVADGDVATNNIQHPGLLISHHMEDITRGAGSRCRPRPITLSRRRRELGRRASSFVISTADRKLHRLHQRRAGSLPPAAVGLQIPEKPFGARCLHADRPGSNSQHVESARVRLASRQQCRAGLGAARLRNNKPHRPSTRHGAGGGLLADASPARAAWS